MFVRTERLFLRPGWPEDLDDLLETFREDAFQRTVAVSAMPRTREAARAYLDRPRDPRFPHFFMYRRGTQGAKLVGGVGLGPHGDEVEVGYWIAAAFRGQGYALEALRAVVEQARTLGHRRLVAKHFTDNDASVRVLEAAGFHDTGDAHLRYSAGRGEEALAHVYAIDLERRRWPHMESPDEMLSA
ncbi:GNAT family N-acetyltransferase [Novosphingobium mangrovi (ex Huang et al. 2023)]|uniref:GNAT family N-acetyltransferase n=1 Tax=Novosphingobium mangrovi (ex Huang et al. 2023) TaxID=2976432 RepID=A0ABT2I0E3_9SPHN|nr:GNAT family N-acetyltransferase [Novosphingobium mangrovi (ex Huang et al. 2023)]MCT2398272.1 GNAT family N-acetyltransferase [Novosphingobium mangrovi (ex Huang et al. 2023)]